MKMRKILQFIILICMLMVTEVKGQQTPQFSQYLFNGVVINPAYAGSKEYVNFNGLYRKQWAGIDNSPSTQTISADGPLRRNFSWGAFFNNDLIGFQRTTALYGALSYRIMTSKKSRLAFGVSCGVAQYQLNGVKLVTDQPDDPAVPESKITVWTPDARVGLYFNTARFFAGISLWEILSGPIVNNSLIADPSTHFYLSSGFALPLSGSFVLRPSFLVKEDFKGPTNADLTAFLIFRNRIWLGSSYRTRILNKDRISEGYITQAKDAIAIMLEVFPLENLRIGYSYDISTNVLKKYPTHEISLGYFIIPKTQEGMLTPRYF
jgi:type IX secretion system PorP/SprF family membrane protein